MTVRCPSNGHSASSTSGLLAPAAQTSAGGTACSRLPWPAVLPHRTHRPTLLHCWPGHSSTHPHLLLFSSDSSQTSKPSYSPPREQPLPSLPRLHRSLPRLRRRPPPWCSRRGLVNVVNDRHASEVDCTWRC